MKFIVIPADISQPIRLEEFEPNRSNGRYAKAVELIGGGFIQLVNVAGYKKLDMCTDEDGKMKRMEFNYRATIIASIAGGDRIVGDVVICGKNFSDVLKAAPSLEEELQKITVSR